MTANKELLATDKQLKESDNRFRTIAEYLKDVIAITDSSGIITYISPGAVSLFGCQPEEMMGCFIGDYVSESDLPDISAFTEAFHTGINPERMERPGENADIYLIWRSAHPLS